MDHTNIRFANLEINQHQKRKLHQLDTCLDSLAKKWTAEDFQNLMSQGLVLNEINESLFDQIFCMPGSGGDEYESSLKIWRPDTLQKMQTLDSAILSCMNEFSAVTHPIAYVPTMKTKLGRERIPVHSHRRRDLTKENEFTMTLAMRLSFHSPETASFRFFPPERFDFESARERDGFYSEKRFIEANLSQRLQVFVFSASLLHHTVLFSNDFYLFAVLNNLQRSSWLGNLKNDVVYTSTGTANGN